MFAEINKDPAAAKAFSDDVIAPLLDVRMAEGWLGEGDCAGRMLPQPEVSGTRLDDTLDNGFVALVPGAGDIDESIAGHTLWRALNPTVHTLPAELEEFAGLADPAGAARPLRAGEAGCGQCRSPARSPQGAARARLGTVSTRRHRAGGDPVTG